LFNRILGENSLEESGLHDPYWYEISVGQEYLISMLNTDSKITSVTLQKSIGDGLDDVVITYSDNSQKCIQVKHSRVDANFTFASLISKTDKKPSLVRKLATGWKDQSQNIKTEVTLLTNRQVGEQKSQVEIGNKKIKVCDLNTLYNHIKTNGPKKEKGNDRLNNGIDIFYSELDFLSAAEQKQFLDDFNIIFDYPSLDTLEKNLIDLITKTLGCSPAISKKILSLMDNACRKWATSERGSKEEITVDEFLDKIGVLENKLFGTHEIPPPGPFFESRKAFSKDLTNLIKTSDKQIIFFKGHAGSGKSSVISYLANSSTTLFDLRFHTFIPLQVSGDILPLDSEKIVTPRYFWSDLLTQIRVNLRGNLSKYKVPVLNSILDDDELRTHVLRICERIGEEEDRKVIIAIDGIDHAARSELSLTFLDTLPSPHELPKSIQLLFAGQPPETYSKYPSWLKQPNSDVQIIDIPDIDVEDISILLKENLNWSKDEILLTSLKIQSLVQGNTLAAVFAAEECKKATSADKAIELLENRNLQWNLSKYYESIWNSSFKNIPEKDTEFEISIAATFSLLKTVIPPSLMSSMFSHFKLSEREWTAILDSLCPLLISDNTSYRVLHNDVRIFLIGKMNIHNNITSSIVSDMADFLLNPKCQFKEIKQYNIFKLLRKSNRLDDLVTIINESFILDNYVHGRSEDLIVDEILEVISVTSCEDRPLILNDIVNIFLSCLANYTIERSLEYFDISKSSIENPTERFVRKNEIRVQSKTEWNIKIILNLLNDCRHLIDRDEIGRGVELFKRWFPNPNDFSWIKILDRKDVFWEHHNREKEFSQDFKEVIKDLGYMSYFSRSWDIFSQDNTFKDEDILDDFQALVANGGFEAACYHPELASVKYFLKNISFYYIDDYISLLESFIQHDKWKEMFYLARNMFLTINDRSIEEQITICFAISILKQKVEYRKWPILDTKYLKGNWSNIKERTSPEKYFCYLSVVHALQTPARPISGIVSDIIDNCYFWDKEKLITLKQIIFLSASVSRLLLESGDSAYKYFDFNEFFLSFSNYLKSPSKGIRSYIRDRSLLTSDVINCITYNSSKLRTSDFDKIRLLLADRLMDPNSFWTHRYILKFFVSLSETKTIKSYLDVILDEDSFLWSIEPNERLEFINFLKKSLGTHFYEQIYSADLISKWGLVHPVDHKDYTLSDMHDLLSEFLSRHPNNWKTCGLKAISISSYYDEKGSNRIHSYILETTIKAAINSGPKEFWKLINAKADGYFLFHLSDRIIINAIIQSTQSTSFGEDDLFYLWQICKSILPGHSKDTTSMIANCHACFSTLADINMFNGLKSLLDNDSLGKIAKRDKDHGKKYWFDHQESKSNATVTLPDQEEINGLDAELSNIDSRDYDHYKNTIQSLVSLIISSSEFPKGVRDQLISIGIKTLFRHKHQMSFHNSELGKLLDCLLRHITQEEKYALTKLYLKHIAENERTNYWTGTSKDDLGSILPYLPDDESDWSHTINKVIDAHVNLVTGNGNLPIKLPTVTLANSLSIESNWASYALMFILEVLNTSYSEYQESSWKALTSIVLYNHDLFNIILQRWDTFSVESKIKFVGILEYSSWKSPKFYKRFSKEVETLITVRDPLKLRIRFSVAKHSKADKDLNIQYRSTEKDLKNLENYKLLEVNSDTDGLVPFTQKTSAFFSKLRMVNKLLNSEYDELIEGFVAKHHVDSKANNPSERVYRNLDSVIIIQEDYLDLMYEYIDHLIFTKQLTPESNFALAQVIINGDDPYLINLESIYEIAKFDLKNLDESKGTHDAISFFHTHIIPIVERFTPANGTVLSSTTTLFSYKKDYQFDYDYTSIDSYSAGIKQRPSMVGGCSFSLLSKLRLEPQNTDEFLVVQLGGILRLSGASLITYPQIRLIDQLGLQPKDGNPLHLCNPNSKAELQFQRIRLLGHEEVRSPYYRSTKIDQWIGNDVFTSEVKTHFGDKFTNQIRYTNANFSSR
jgi:hypothetical protein